jgi:hypothetical protein
MAKAAAPYLHSRLMPSLRPEHQPSSFRPLQLIVQFEAGDPSLKPVFDIGE